MLLFITNILREEIEEENLLLLYLGSTWVAGAGERILEAAGGFYGDHHGQPSHNNETIQITIQ